MIESILTMALGAFVALFSLIPVGGSENPKGKVKGKIIDVKAGERGDTIFMLRFSEDGKEHTCPSLPYKGLMEDKFTPGSDADIQYTYADIFGHRVYSAWLAGTKPESTYNKKMVGIIGLGIVGFGAVMLVLKIFMQ